MYESRSNWLGTLCMGALGGLYRPTPQGYNGNPAGRGPSRQCLRPLTSPPSAGARRLVGQTGCRLFGRQAGPIVQGLVAGWLLLLNPGDEGFAEVGVATVPPSGG